MIYVECTFLHPQTFSPVGQLKKEFDNQGDFNAWYVNAKRDTHCIINFMKYNPKDDPRQAEYNARRLLLLPRNPELAI